MSRWGVRFKRVRHARGTAIRVGDRVRVLGMPHLPDWSPRARRESEAVFRHIVGTYKRVAGFNELGWVQLEFRIRAGSRRGLHTVWLEPHLLKVHHPVARGSKR
jgi:hypothetical protein